jgi:hypothetical protein
MGSCLMKKTRGRKSRDTVSLRRWTLTVLGGKTRPGL